LFFLPPRCRTGLGNATPLRRNSAWVRLFSPLPSSLLSPPFFVLARVVFRARYASPRRFFLVHFRLPRDTRWYTLFCQFLFSRPLTLQHRFWVWHRLSAPCSEVSSESTFSGAFPLLVPFGRGTRIISTFNRFPRAFSPPSFCSTSISFPHGHHVSGSVSFSFQAVGVPDFSFWEIFHFASSFFPLHFLSGLSRQVNLPSFYTTSGGVFFPRIHLASSIVPPLFCWPCHKCHG